MRRRDFLFAAVAVGVLPRAVVAGNAYINNEQVLAYIDEMHQKHQFVPQELTTFFSRLSVNEKVLKLLGTPTKPAKKVYWREYRKQRLTGKKIARGVRFMQKNRDALRRAEEQYGVPAAIITAIIGVETNYGAYLGNFSVAETLATLAFGHPTRHQEFRRELSQLLIYARDARLDPLTIRGSYAGAFGIPQFLPSNVRRYAVDFDDNGRVDLLTDADAIGSIGNFLKEYGWRRDVAVNYLVRVVGDAAALVSDGAAKGYKAVWTPAELEQRGVHPKTPPAAGEERFVFIDLENRYDTEYRIGTENFYALTRYNKSFKYAATVTDLADALAETI